MTAGPAACYAALSLLDHQMVDRTGRDCGKVDDLELDLTDDGDLVVTHLLAGPGILAERLGPPTPRDRGCDK